MDLWDLFYLSSSVVLDAAMVNNWLVGWNHKSNLPVFLKFRGEDPNIWNCQTLGTGISRVFTYTEKWLILKVNVYVHDTYNSSNIFLNSYPPEPTKQNGTSSKLKLEWSYLPPRRCSFPPRHSIHARVRDWDQDQRKPLETKDHQRSPVFFLEGCFFCTKNASSFWQRELRWKDILCIS